MSTPRVSVVMTTYNGVRFLGKAIESILYQSYMDLELIVVDDGSTDSSASVIRSFCARDSRVRGIFLKTNLGVAKAANRGLRVTRGEYIARMDSDDLCHRDRLAKQVSYLEKHPEIFVLGCRSVNIDEWDKRKNSAKDKMNFCCGRLLLARRMAEGEYLVVHASLVVRKFCFEEVGGYRECFPMGEDLDFYTRILERYGAVFENLSERLYYYRRYKESLTNVYSLDIHVKIQALVFYSALCRTQGKRDPLAKVKRLNFCNLPLPNTMKKHLEEIIFLLSFSSILYQDDKEFYLANLRRAENLLSNLSCISKDLPPPFSLYVKYSQPFIHLAHAWLGYGYWFKGIRCIALAFMTYPWASVIFFFKRFVFHSSRFIGRLFCVCS